MLLSISNRRGNKLSHLGVQQALDLQRLRGLLLLIVGWRWLQRGTNSNERILDSQRTTKPSAPVVRFGTVVVHEYAAETPIAEERTAETPNIIGG